MDDIELAICKAWEPVHTRLVAEPGELERRLARRATAGLRQPPRAWCLAVRASDTRLEGKPVTAPAATDGGAQRIESQRVSLDAARVRRLCDPVRIDPPGQTIHEVAAKLGVTVECLLTVRADGVLRSRHVKGLGGVRGWPVPLLYTERLLDPGSRGFVCADPLWSWTATFRTNRIPPAFAQTLTRVAYYRSHCGAHEYDEARHPEVGPTKPKKRRVLHVPRAGPDDVWYKWKGDQYVGYDWRAGEMARENYERAQRAKGRRLARYRATRASQARPSESGGSLHFNGWRWLCPACGQRCRTIYLPLPRLNLLQWSAPELVRRAEAPPPEIDGLACMRCHGVRYLNRTHPGCWNHLISYLSGGLMFGAEVPRPQWVKPVRTRAYAPRPGCEPSKRRAEMVERLLEGLTYAQIARRMGLSENTVDSYARKTYAAYGVRRREELARRLGRTLPPRRAKKSSSTGPASANSAVLAGSGGCVSGQVDRRASSA
jgi:DNA-binding CsgD family transcriptional regulator